MSLLLSHLEHVEGLHDILHHIILLGYLHKNLLEQGKAECFFPLLSLINLCLIRISKHYLPLPVFVATSSFLQGHQWNQAGGESEGY